MALSIAIVAAGTLGIAIAQSVGILYLVAIPFDFAVGMLSPIVNAHVVDVLPQSKSGTANALFYAAGDVGFITCPTVWGIVAEATSYEVMIVASSAVLAACAALSLACGFNGRRAVR